ncbi:unnamed protein product [Coccothraustes coccothraustes]
MGLCKRDGLNLFLPLFLLKLLVIREKSPFPTRGRDIYANSPACYRNRRLPQKAEAWEQHLLRKVVKRSQGAPGDSGSGTATIRGRRWPQAPHLRPPMDPPGGAVPRPQAAQRVRGRGFVSRGIRPGASQSPRGLVPGKSAQDCGLCLPRRLTLAIESGPGAGRVKEGDLPWGKLFRV